MQDLFLGMPLPKKKWCITAVLMPVLICLFYIFFTKGTFEKGNLTYKEIIDVVTISILSSGIKAAVTEEIVFRGMILRLLQNTFGKKCAVFVSSFLFAVYHFDGIDYDEKTHRNTIFLFDQKSWDQEVDDENGNYDYLMGADLDFGNEETVQEVTSWLYWYINLTKINGLRLDAVKHIPASFYKNLLPKIYHDFNKELFTVGEYWHGDVYHLEKYLKEVNFEMSLFDVPLHYHFYDASHNENYDFSHIFDQTLVSMYPSNAVIFVDNHDTEPSQSLASFIPDWFKGHAYCLTLLRKAGYPCVFYGDLEGIDYENVSSKKEMLQQLLSLRKQYNKGNQEDYFDHPHLIGWIRRTQTKAMAIIMTNSTGGIKPMYVGKEDRHCYYVNVFNGYQRVLINEDGYGDFYCEDKNFAVYVKE